MGKKHQRIYIHRGFNSVPGERPPWTVQKNDPSGFSSQIIRIPSGIRPSHSNAHEYQEKVKTHNKSVEGKNVAATHKNAHNPKKGQRTLESSRMRAKKGKTKSTTKKTTKSWAQPSPISVAHTREKKRERSFVQIKSQ